MRKGMPSFWMGSLWRASKVEGRCCSPKRQGCRACFGCQAQMPLSGMLLPISYSVFVFSISIFALMNGILNRKADSQISGITQLKLKKRRFYPTKLSMTHSPCSLLKPSYRSCNDLSARELKERTEESRCDRGHRSHAGRESPVFVEASRRIRKCEGWLE